MSAVLVFIHSFLSAVVGMLLKSNNSRCLNNIFSDYLVLRTRSSVCARLGYDNVAAVAGWLRIFRMKGV